MTAPCRYASVAWAEFACFHEIPSSGGWQSDCATCLWHASDMLGVVVAQNYCMCADQLKPEAPRNWTEALELEE